MSGVVSHTNDIYGRAGRLHLEVCNRTAGVAVLSDGVCYRRPIGVRQFHFGRLGGRETVGDSTSWRRRDCVRRSDNFGPPFAIPVAVTGRKSLAVHCRQETYANQGGCASPWADMALTPSSSSFSDGQSHVTDGCPWAGDGAIRRTSVQIDRASTVFVSRLDTEDSPASA
jgi:hypothetical protein